MGESNHPAHITVPSANDAEWNGIIIVPGCLTIHQSKAFLLLLVTTTFSTYFMAAPVIEPIVDGVYAMYNISRSHPGCNRLWWDWWGSYVIFGGPGGRWVLGTALGYWVAEPQLPFNPRGCRHGLPFMQPTSSAALTLIMALSLATFCLVLALQMMFRLLRGHTTIEALQTSTLRKRDKVSPRFLWLPGTSIDVPVKHQSYEATALGVGRQVEEMRRRPTAQLAHTPSQTHGSTVSLDFNTRIYDLGIWENAKLYLSRPMFPSKNSAQ
ncbi:Zf-CCCH domain protein [Rhizoctonia solani]|uniref:Zf-CCCH domain protein n=1 Tax=Rhizoctonia solani TaxID=456999 RepID=A0A8H8NRW9_9AGAM|nr:Zf-CCCH domain protein [Rhizoctonia solani]QRW17117.1 Zf-CCCH domain protein [Rhizoctonia solani]